MTVRRVVIDHVDLLVADLAASRRFYEAALAPLGFGIVAQSETSYGFGVEGAEDFAINLIAPGDTPTTGAHVAFVAESKEAVQSLYDAAIRAGGRSKLEPALHPEYHPGYFGAFVYDPDGNNVEAVYHDRSAGPEPSP